MRPIYPCLLILFFFFFKKVRSSYSLYIYLPYVCVSTCMYVQTFIHDIIVGCFCPPIYYLFPLLLKNK